MTTQFTITVWKKADFAAGQEKTSDHNNSSLVLTNNGDQGGSRPSGLVRVNSGWFDLTKLPRTTLMKPTGQVRVSLGQFDPTEPPGTTVTKGEASLQGRF